MKTNSLLVYKNFDEHILNLKNEAKNYSFLNLASISHIFKDSDITENVTYFCDGWLGCLLFSVLSRKKIHRVSFDFTSIAGEVFQHAQRNQQRVFLVGATEAQLTTFAHKISEKYPNLLIVGRNNGFFADKEEPILAKKIMDLKADIVIVSMGAGKQEHFLKTLSSHGFSGTGFTCGGFIKQESMNNSRQYYPQWINKFHLRAFYRMLREPHTIRRYLFTYPVNSLRLCIWVFLKKIKIK